MTGGQQLLNTAGDYFQFVTKFFEIIKISAPHIYHSALEHSPQSSIVRERYYFKSFQDHRPWVICGVSSSWKPAGVNGKYGSYTWSPCGQLFAAQTPTSVEIRDALTLDKHSTLQPTKPIPKDLEPIGHLPSTLAYSPDGHSLAGCFSSAATIWDIQTGGVIKEMECGVVDALPKSLVWSLDGTTIGAIFLKGEGNWIVFTCDIASIKVSTHTVQSPYEPCLWPCGDSIWMMTISENKTTINTFEIWPTVTVFLVKSHSIAHSIGGNPPPAMHQDRFLSGDLCHWGFSVYDIHNQRFLLRKYSFFTTNCFSPDGGLLATTSNHEVHISRLEEHAQYYHQWKTFPLWKALGDAPRGLKFSPTSSSLLISRDGYLEVQPLEGSITHTPEKITLIKFSSNGTYLVTAFKDKSTIIITNLYTDSSQLIDTKVTICQLTLVSNILFMGSHRDLVAWKLTAEGTVDGASDIRRIDSSSRLWIKEWMGDDLSFWASGQTGVIRSFTNIVFYNMETGEELKHAAPSTPLPPLPSDDLGFSSWPTFSYHHPLEYHNYLSGDNLPDCDVETGEEFKSAAPSIPSPSSPSWKDFYHDSDGTDFRTWPSFSCYDLVECNDHPSKDNLPASTPWFQEGWLMYPEGEYQHRLWLPTHWRTKWEEVHCLNDIKILRLVLASGKVVIKF